MEQKKKPSIKMWIMIILATIVLLFILSISINFLRVRKGNPPIFYFSKSINSLDGSIVYNIFPYKITDYNEIIKYSNNFHLFFNHIIINSIILNLLNMYFQKKNMLHLFLM